MEAFLKQSKADQKTAFEQAAAKLRLAPAAVEKDFWVSWTLKQLFTLPCLDQSLTFKGGTSLSKAWNLIDRFSEDIDLVIHRDALGFGGEDDPEKATGSSRRKKLLDALQDACRSHIKARVLPEYLNRIEAVLGKTGKALELDPSEPQTLLFHYPSQFTSPGQGYLRPTVKLEFGARSDPWPADSRTVQPMVAEIFPEAFPDAKFPVHALLPTRTFWEKAMLLHEETFRPGDKPRRPRMARHYFDLHQLIQRGVAKEAQKDEGLFDEVLNHRQVFFKQAWVDYSTLRPGSLRLVPLKGQEDAWREDYSAMVEMFSTPPPPFDSILALVKEFEDQFNAS